MSGRMPFTVAAVAAAAVTVRVWARLPPFPSKRTLPGFSFCTMGRWAEVMPLALMPVMISWAACSRRVRVFSFASTQLVGVVVGAAVGVDVVDGVVDGVVEGVSVGVSVVVGRGTEEDGAVLGPAVGGALVSLQP